MTLLALTLSGAIFIAVQVTNASLAAETYYIHADMRIDLAQGRDDTASSNTAISTLERLPNVARVESIDPAIITLAQGELKLLGLPADTQLYQPQVVAGRWLRAHELGALVINNYAAARLHLRVGDMATVQWAAQQAQQAEFRIVGIVHEGGEVDGSANPHGRQGLAFTTLENLNTLRHLPADAAERLWLRARDPSPQALSVLRGRIPQALAAAGLPNTYAETLQQFLQGPNPLPIVSSLFDAMVILVSLVGLLGLAHTLTASVLERRLEIGMVRALGATGWRVGTIFLVEGLALALLAWESPWACPQGLVCCCSLARS